MQFFVGFLIEYQQLLFSKRFHNDLLKNDEKFFSFSVKEPMNVTDNWLVDTVLKFDR